MIGLLMQKIATTNMYVGKSFRQVTVLKTQSPKILKVIRTDKHHQVVFGFFNLLEKEEKRYNKSFLNGSFQDKDSRRKMIRTFTIPQTLMGKYSNLVNKLEDICSKGGNISINDIFNEGIFVNSQGVVKGRGFSGGMRRHNFDGLRATHGVSVSHRAIGSTGCRKPNRVIKGRKMPGRYGGHLITVRNLLVVKVNPEQELIVIKGSVPGCKGSISKVILN